MPGSKRKDSDGQLRAESFTLDEFRALAHALHERWGLPQDNNVADAIENESMDEPHDD